MNSLWQWKDSKVSSPITLFDEYGDGGILRILWSGSLATTMHDFPFFFHSWPVKGVKNVRFDFKMEFCTIIMKQNAAFLVAQWALSKYSSFNCIPKFMLILFSPSLTSLFSTDTTDQQQRLALIRELETLIHVGRHPNIVSLVGACTFEGKVGFSKLRIHS